jgi:hypothetical protein
MSLDWTECKVVRVASLGPAEDASSPSRSSVKKPSNQQWCVNSERLAALLTQMM